MIGRSGSEFRADLASIESFEAMRRALDPATTQPPSNAERLRHIGSNMVSEIGVIAQEIRLARAENALAAGQCTMSQLVQLAQNNEPVVIHPFKR